MKRILLTIIISMAFIVPCYAVNGHGEEVEIINEEEPEGAKCPHTNITDQNKCYDCHKLRQVEGKWKWSVKTPKYKNPLSIFEYPDYTMVNGDEIQGYYAMDGRVDIYTFTVFTDYVYRMGFKEVLIDIYSGGGSLLEGWSICSMIQQMSKRGIKVVTQTRSFSASAAFLVFVSGDIRLVEPTAYLMTHELMSLAWLKVETPSSDEDEAKTKRMFQDVIHNWLASRSDVTKEELDEKVRHKDWWMNGEEAVKLKFATGYIK